MDDFEVMSFAEFKLLKKETILEKGAIRVSFDGEFAFWVFPPRTSYLNDQIEGLAYLNNAN